MDDTIQTMIKRHGLPPKLRRLVDTMTEAGLDVSNPPEEGRKEVAQVKLLVDGDRLISAILATFLGAQDMGLPDNEHDPFDHDGNGEPGGSLPKDKAEEPEKNPPVTVKPTPKPKGKAKADPATKSPAQGDAAQTS